MKLFVIGDYRSGTGPANVTKRLIEELTKLNKNTFFLKSSGKLARFLELMIKLPRAEACVLSGHSKQNLVALKQAHSLGKKVAFIMHGCVEYENAINDQVDEGMNQVERQVLKESDLILAVSDQFAAWLKEKYPEYKTKIGVLRNGVDWECFMAPETIENSKTTSYRILSVGGGMKRKRILQICRAIDSIKKDSDYKGPDIVLTVVGDEGKDTNAIDAYKFVDNRGLVSKEEIRGIYGESDLFIQNSCFETFGLAPLEALISGCDLLLSKNIGALSVFNKDLLEVSDIIENCEEPQEIASKIKMIMEKPNHMRLLSAVDREETSFKRMAERLLYIMGNNEEI